MQGLCMLSRGYTKYTESHSHFLKNFHQNLRARRSGTSLEHQHLEEQGERCENQKSKVIPRYMAT